MKSVLIIGGYGGFGARLSVRLAKAGWQVLVGGRRPEAAKAFCATLAGSIPVALDRNADLGPLLSEFKPFLLIDAAGPFQSSDYRVLKACIAAGVHYLDLADARDFVCSIGELNDAATQAGVAVISGGSSVPALSGAIVRNLVDPLDDVKSIDIAISASNRATAGPSVAASIMSYVGKPLDLWRGRCWTKATGWHMLRRIRFEVAGRKSLNRLTALSDVPDHTLMPDMIAGRPATTFRAGPEFRFQVLSIWALSWLVKWRVIASLAPLSGWLRYLQAPTNKLGSDRSGMVVEVKSWRDKRAHIARWTLIAEDGDGPEIPTFAAVVLAKMIDEGTLPVGARDASSFLSLDQFQPQFDELSIYSERTDTAYTPLFQRVLGPRFDVLPKAVRELHMLIGNSGAQGQAIVTRGAGPLVGMVCAIMGFPRAGKVPVHVNFDEHVGIEYWTRDFGGVRFSSRLNQSGDYLVESFGPMSFKLTIDGNENGLSMDLFKGWSVFGIPLPRWLGPSTQAREFQEGDDFCFDVAINLPLIGNVVRYQGRLRPVA